VMTRSRGEDGAEAKEAGGGGMFSLDEDFWNQSYLPTSAPSSWTSLFSTGLLSTSFAPLKPLANPHSLTHSHLCSWSKLYTRTVHSSTPPFRYVCVHGYLSISSLSAYPCFFFPTSIHPPTYLHTNKQINVNINCLTFS
jgi:hypothetical protein